MEVQQAIEQRAGLRLADLAATADRVREACQPLQREALAVLSPICDLAGFAKEASLLERIETIDWIVPPANFIQVLAPRQVMSRDNMALSQGLQAPLHLNVEAAIVSNTTTLSASRDFLNDAIRLARQVRTKLLATPNRKRIAAVAVDQPTDERLVRQLRRRSFALFVLAALVVVASGVLTERMFVRHPVGTAAVVVGAVTLVFGLYAILVDRTHASRAFAVGAAIAGTIAAVDQVLGRF